MARRSQERQQEEKINLLTEQKAQTVPESIKVFQEQWHTSDANERHSCAIAALQPLIFTPQEEKNRLFYQQTLSHILPEIIFLSNPQHIDTIHLNSHPDSTNRTIS